MKSMFVSTQGSYSDFCVTGIWSSYEKAVQYAGDPDDVQEWKIDCAGGDVPLVMRCPYYCRMADDGTVEKEECRRSLMVPENERGQAKRGNRYFYATSYVSVEHARKLCAEKRQEWLARKAILGERA